VRCAEAADQKADAAIAALQKKYETKLRALRTRLDTASSAASRSAARHEAEHGTGAQVTTLLGGLFGGSRSRTAILTEARRTSASAGRVDAAREKAGVAEQAILDLEDELTVEVADLDTTWATTAGAVETVTIPLEKVDVVVADLRLLWIPV
jgi:hypothetical protein